MAVLGALAVGSTPAFGASRASDDILYIGDRGDDSIKSFDMSTGALGVFSSGSLDAPGGLVFAPTGALTVSNQNAEKPYPGQIDSLDRKGVFAGTIVGPSDPHAVFAPRGIVRTEGRYVVADMGDADFVEDGGQGPNPQPAKVSLFHQATGKWDKDLEYPGFANTCDASGSCVQWSPRAVVVGPDLALYVSVMKFMSSPTPTVNRNTVEGRVIRFAHPYGKSKGEVFIDGANCGGCDLARPEGLVFGPDGKLYVTSFRKSSTAVDRILVFDGKSGSFRAQDSMNLWEAGQSRSYAQALLFGPKGALYVPISGGDAGVGSVRKYDVTTKTFEVVVPAGTVNSPVSPWYLTFGRTDPGTLAYKG